MRVQALQSCEKAVDVARRPRMDPLQIESGNRGAMQNRANATDRGEVDLVFSKTSRIARKSGFGFVATQLHDRPQGLLERQQPVPQAAGRASTGSM